MYFGYPKNSHEQSEWGKHKRTLSGLAEASHALADTTEAEELLRRALYLPRGYAGYHIVVAWTLAKSIQIIGPADAPSLINAH